MSRFAGIILYSRCFLFMSLADVQQCIVCQFTYLDVNAYFKSLADPKKYIALIQYLILGTGKPIAFLHNFLGSSVLLKF
jgi:hypothetical protein